MAEPDLKKANICIDCLRYGCPWEKNFTPVPGWDATPTVLKRNHGQKGMVHTYAIRSCPLFIDGTKQKSYDPLEEKLASIRTQATGKRATKSPERKIFARNLKTGKLRIYSGQSEAAQDGFDQYIMSRVLAGAQYTHRGWKFWWEGSPEPEGQPGKKPSFYKAVKGTNTETGKVIRFQSIQAVRKAGFSPRSVSACVCGRQKNHRGYIWEREDAQ